MSLYRFYFTPIQVCGARVQDLESWLFAKYVSANLVLDRHPACHKLVMCMSNRPSIYLSPPEFVEIQAQAKEANTLIKLGPLTLTERYTMLSKLVGAMASGVDADRDESLATGVKLGNDVAGFVSSMAAGNPKAIQELVLEVLKDEVRSEKGSINLFILFTKSCSFRLFD